ncbi:MAG: hypothetical protein MUC62_10070 [Candidatus Thermoplasmatota archaeon]|jgi:hypothetical protein|nr:hypothetical protein [Candidatus Thermoplasmatota archaeon]
MIEQVKLAYRFLLVMGLGALLLVMALFVPVLSSNADFSIYNTGWNGCSSLGRTVYGTGTFMPTIDVSGSTEEYVVHTSLPDIETKLEPLESALLFLGPDSPFSKEEGGFVHRFLIRGGLVLLADDFGSGSGLLSMLNTTTTISGQRMVSLAFEKSGDFSVASDMAVHPVTEGVSMVLLNHPSTIVPSPLARALVNSSHSSWLDIDADDRLDTDEPKGPFPLLTIEPYGRGELMVLSDPSIMINQMQGPMNGSILVRNIVAYLASGRKVLVMDETHRDLTNPVHVLNVYVNNISPWMKGVMIGGSVVLFVVMGSSLPARSKERMERLLKKLLGGETPRSLTVDEMFEDVRKRHPDWDRRTLARIRASIGE